MEGAAVPFGSNVATEGLLKFRIRLHGVFVMLVLSRKKNERIKLDDDISIVVVEIRGDKVRLGIEAPQQVKVHRQEVYDAIAGSGGAD